MHLEMTLWWSFNSNGCFWLQYCKKWHSRRLSQGFTNIQQDNPTVWNAAGVFFFFFFFFFIFVWMKLLITLCYLISEIIFLLGKDLVLQILQLSPICGFV